MSRPGNGWRASTRPGSGWRSRPLWQVHLDGFGQGSALLVRIHHALADGISLARVLLSLMSESTEAHFTPEPAARAEPPARAWWKLLRGVSAGVRAALGRGAALLSESVQVRELGRAAAGWVPTPTSTGQPP